MDGYMLGWSGGPCDVVVSYDPDGETTRPAEPHNNKRRSLRADDDHF